MAIGSSVENATDQPMKIKRIKLNNDKKEEQEEEVDDINFLDWELISKNYGLKDCYEEEVKMSLSYKFNFDSPEIAELLVFMVNLEVSNLPF